MIVVGSKEEWCYLLSKNIDADKRYLGDFTETMLSVDENKTWIYIHIPFVF